MIASGETIDDTLLAAGESVLVQGTVNGDLIALGREVRIEGTVTGSVMCAGKRLEVAGSVRGDLYTLNETLAMRGHVGRSVHAMTQTTDLDAAATVDRDLFALGKEIRIAGTLGRRLSAGVQRAELSGTIGGRAEVNAERLHVFDSAHITGDLVANVPNEARATLGSAAKIEGATRISAAPDAHGSRHELNRFAQPRFYLWQALWLAAAVVCGLLLRWLAPVVFEPHAPSAMNVLKAAGSGLVALVMTPVVALLAGLSIVGLPAALIGLGAWMAALYLAGVVTSAWLGRLVLRQGATDLRAFVVALVAGQVILRLVRPLPYVGGLTCFGALLLGLGLLLVASRAAVIRLRTR